MGWKLGFWDPLAHFEVEGGRKLGSGCVSQNSRFLQRVVCLCGAVGVCGACHRVGHRVGHDVIIFTPEGIFDQKRLEV